MSISKNEGEALWDAFLKRWPLETLSQITLEEYSKAGDPDCFTYGWLENKTAELGSIRGGSAFKFGIYSRSDQIDKKDGNGKSYSSKYGWYSKNGLTQEDAFLKVRKVIVEIANSAYLGDLDAIDKAEFGLATKWKIAFLYQNRSEPKILPVYSADILTAYIKPASRASLHQLQKSAMAQCKDTDVLTLGRKIWEYSEAITLSPKDALAFFEGKPERFQPIKKPTEKIAGFTTLEGRSVAISLEQKEARLWLEPGEWLNVVMEQLKDIKHYSSDKSRNHNLTANAPKLDKGNPALFLTVPTHAALVALCDAYDNTDISEVSIMQTNENAPLPTTLPLNQILFGPPGTGKTFATIDEALRILDSEFFEKNKADRTKLKSRFDQLVVAERVRFVTFHQSFSYEDFIEGLRAVTNDEKQLEYIVEPGIFKRLCDDARTHAVKQEAGIRNNPHIWKISINGTGASPTKTYCLDHGEARIGWGETGDLRNLQKDNVYYNTLKAQTQGTLNNFSEEIMPGDILLCIHSAETIGAIGVVTGDYRFDETVPQDVIGDYKHVRPVNWLYRDLQLPIFPLNDGKQFTLKTVYSMDRFTWGDLLAHIERSGINPTGKTTVSVDVTEVQKPYVLIIDEINRGNISRIFGELISLIEPSKRSGKDESLSVALPYSKKQFSVPSNVYLIGTMNTADRSLAGLDIALRRRFTFKEMPPKYELLDGVKIDGLDIGELLRKMNERIEVLLDREHCLGHAYFMSLKDKGTFTDLKFIFRQQILPLLQEYFFEDWERIGWVLNDQRKPSGQSFVEKITADHAKLFGADVASNLQNVDKRWRINESAFDNIESYRSIVKDAA